MKLRQFHRLDSLPLEQQQQAVVEGLGAIAERVRTLVDDLETCNTAEAFAASRLAHNIAREEAAKFLILI